MTILPRDTASLSDRVREETRVDHRNAETVSFITELMEGSRSRRDYALLISQYQPIYSALEMAVGYLRTSAEAPGVKDLFDPLLNRREAIKADLDSLLSAEGMSPEPVILESTTRYTERIREIANRVERVCAHHYVRLLGDLSGGQAIAQLVRRHYSVTPEQLTMYTFSGIPKLKVYKDTYRLRLNSLAFTADQEADFLEEAAIGFSLNRAVFEELGRYTAALDFPPYPPPGLQPPELA